MPPKNYKSRRRFTPPPAPPKPNFWQYCENVQKRLDQFGDPTVTNLQNVIGNLEIVAKCFDGGKSENDCIRIMREIDGIFKREEI